jgi:single-strand DNA-binding protein
MLNLTLVGNLGADATVGATRRGTPIATLSVAVNQARTDTTTGERTETAEWFRVRAMGRLVDLAQRLTMGTRVLVIGRLDIGHYQSRESEARVSYDVWADELVPFNPRPDTVGSAGGRRENDQTQPAQPATPTGPGNRVQHADPSVPTGASRIRRNEDDEELPW